MPISFLVLNKAGVETTPAFLLAKQKASDLVDYLNTHEIQRKIAEVHVLGASSSKIQELIADKAKELGFESEKKGLFNNYSVQGLRPDYYCPVGDTGILLEVERGKTITNNMDLLDIWKCHICAHARYLLLLVPQERHSKKGTILRHFKQVSKRFSTFFELPNHINVDAVFLIGY